MAENKFLFAESVTLCCLDVKTKRVLSERRVPAFLRSHHMTAGSKNSPLTEEEAENRVRENPTFSLTGEASQTESQVNGTYVTPQRVFCCFVVYFKLHFYKLTSGLS